MVGTLLYPLALTVQLPIYMYLIVMEKEDGVGWGGGGQCDTGQQQQVNKFLAELSFGASWAVPMLVSG